MAPPLPKPDTDARLRETVLDWFMRHNGETWSAGDEAAFTDWLDADPANRAAYARWTSHWNTLEAMPAETVAALRRNLARDKALECTPQRPARRAFLFPAFSALAVAAVVSCIGYFAWEYVQAQPVFVQAFNTQRGQQLDAPLPDGSRLQLDTATRVEVSYFRQRREVRLLEGQAMFTVQADAARPFHVLSGSVRVTVTGTRFAVRHTPGMPGADGVQVSVEEGRVRVGRYDPARGEGVPPFAELTAGQMVAEERGALGPVTAVPSGGIAPWRQNRLSFVDAPLGRVIAEFERYGNTGLAVRDPAVAALRLSGSFDLRDLASLRRMLPSALPVQLRDAGGVAEVVPEH